MMTFDDGVPVSDMDFFAAGARAILVGQSKEFLFWSDAMRLFRAIVKEHGTSSASMRGTVVGWRVWRVDRVARTRRGKWATDADA